LGSDRGLKRGGWSKPASRGSNRQKKIAPRGDPLADSNKRGGIRSVWGERNAWEEGGGDHPGEHSGGGGEGRESLLFLDQHVKGTSKGKVRGRKRVTGKKGKCWEKVAPSERKKRRARVKKVRPSRMARGNFRKPLSENDR